MPELQREYLALVEADDALERAVEDSQTGGGVEAFRDTVLLRRRVRQFERRAAATGTILDSAADRALATSMLDFWGIRQAYLRRYSDQLRPPKSNGQTLPAATPRLGGSIILAPFDESSAPELPDNPSPFVGLNAFSEGDAKKSIFCGREAAVAELRALLSERRLAIVTGPSGSGKSSLIMAGLVPALQAGAIAGSEKWHYWPPVIPGADPFAALLQALHSGGGDPVRWVAEHRAALERDPRKLVDLLGQIGEGGPSLLIVDQMEEMLSMVADKVLQEKFAAAIVAPSQAATPDHHVIIVIREDFLPRLLKLQPFSSMASLLVSSFRPKPMTSAELRQAIEDPARAVGLKFDEGIVEDLVREVVNDPAALPLLQFTLTQLWRRRRRNRITSEAYAEIGRPAEALGRTAEMVFENLKTEQAKAAARDIFLALVVPAVGAEFVRRRVRRESLHALRDSTQIDRVLDDFVAAGLVRNTPGVEVGDDRFDVMHEALLRNWPRLIAWLKEIRDKDERKLLMLNRARIWEQSGREPDHLAVGAAIAETAEFAAADPLILEYVEASRIQSQAQQKKRRLRWATVGAVIAVLAIAVLVSNWVRQNQLRAQESRNKQALIDGQIALTDTLLAQVEAPLLASFNGPLPQIIANGPGVTGRIRIGLAQQSFLRSPGGQRVVAPSAVRTNELYRLRIDVPFLPGARQARGSASAGALVVAMGRPRHMLRPTDQYWLPVRVVPRVTIQFSNGTPADANRLLLALRQRGFDAPAAQVATTATGQAEVRYYFPQDQQSAERLTNEINQLIGQNLPNVRRVTVQFAKGAGTRTNQGSMEVWLDMSPSQR